MKTIVIGDTHGCRNELEMLVDKAGYQRGIDRLILAGDMVDRGPDSLGIIRYAMSIGAEAVCGNHDNKLLRRAKHVEKARNNPKYVNPMRENPEQEYLISQLSTVELDWLASLPYHIKLEKHNAVVAHAGIVPGIPFEKQKDEAYMMVRYIDNDSGKMKHMVMPGYQQPENSHYWADSYMGTVDVIFGHNVVSLDDIKVWQNSNGGRCFGIDTGCVFGGRLTALVLQENETHEVVQVNAAREYYVSDLF